MLGAALFGHEIAIDRLREYSVSIGATTMIPNETIEPAKSVAELVVKICLIIATAGGALVIILRLIRGDDFFHAVSAIVPASILALFYWMILSQRHSTKKTGSNLS